MFYILNEYAFFISIVIWGLSEHTMKTSPDWEFSKDVFPLWNNNPVWWAASSTPRLFNRCRTQTWRGWALHTIFLLLQGRTIHSTRSSATSVKPPSTQHSWAHTVWNQVNINYSSVYTGKGKNTLGLNNMHQTGTPLSLGSWEETEKCQIYHCLVFFWKSNLDWFMGGTHCSMSPYFLSMLPYREVWSSSKYCQYLYLSITSFSW